MYKCHLLFKEVAKSKLIHFIENEGSCISLVTYKTISWQTIVYIAIPCSIILLYAIGISILFYRKTRNHHRPIICEGSPGNKYTFFYQFGQFSQFEPI